MDNIRVFITGAGAPGAPGIIKSLRQVTERKIEIYGGDMNFKNSVGAVMLDKIFMLPPAVSPDFIKTVMKICLAENIKVIIPLVTKELQSFAQNKSLFSDQGISVSVSDAECLSIANDKFLLMQYCQDIGVPVPKFRLVRSKDEFKRASAYMGYPDTRICFKPPVSNGMRGFRIIRDHDRFGALLYEKPDNIYIGFNEFLSIARDPFELLVMEYLPGDEYSVDVLVDNGKFISAIPRTREVIKMGISFVGTTQKDDEIIEYSKRVVEGLCLHGNIGLQFKRDDKGVPKLIESNPRVQGTIVLCTYAGENMVYEAIKLALGESFEVPPVKWGTKMIRYWDEVYEYN